MWFRQEAGELMDCAVVVLDRFGQEAWEFMGWAVVMVVMVVKGFGVVGFRRSMVDEALVFVNLWFWQEACKHVNLGGRGLGRFR